MISNSVLQKIARNIIRKSLFVKEREIVRISTGSKALKFAEHLAYEASVIGAHPTISYCSDELALKIYRGTKLKYLKRIPKLSKTLARKIDVDIIIEDESPFIEIKLPQDKVQARTRAFKPISKIRNKRIVNKTIKAALVGYPTKEIAKSLGTPFNKLNKTFWNTLSTDPYKLHMFNKRLTKKLKGADKIHIIGKRTDIKLSVRGREPIDDCGLWTEDKTGYLNLPAGEVFYAPVETSANGEIYFDLPCLWHFGKQVKGVWFRFKNGKVVEYKVERGLKNFEDVMKHASGEKYRIAELGIGTNPMAKPTGGMTIVDEKIRGTIHMAIGMNKHFGGRNDATIHWDFFKDMKNGKMFVDGKPFMIKGKFV